MNLLRSICLVGLLFTFSHKVSSAEAGGVSSSTGSLKDTLFRKPGEVIVAINFTEDFLENFLNRRDLQWNRNKTFLMILQRRALADSFPTTIFSEADIVRFGLNIHCFDKRADGRYKVKDVYAPCLAKGLNAERFLQELIEARFVQDDGNSFTVNISFPVPPRKDLPVGGSASSESGGGVSESKLA